jgi:hypothetical protein
MTDTPLTQREQDCWADLYIIVPSVSFDAEGYTRIYYVKDTFTDTTHVLLRRILREIGHKIIKWESYVEIRDGFTSKDWVTLDIKQEDFVAKADKYGCLALSIVEEVEELVVNPFRNSSSPSDDDSPSPQQPPEEDEPSLPSVASVD